METITRLALGAHFVIKVLDFADRAKKNSHITHAGIRRVMLTGPQVIAQAAYALNKTEQVSINKAAESVAILLEDCWSNPNSLVIRDLMPMLIFAGRELVGHATGTSKTALLFGNKLFDPWETSHPAAIKNYETWHSIKNYMED